jgi:hypothetical protein
MEIEKQGTMDIHGDKNTKFFHHLLAITGIKSICGRLRMRMGGPINKRKT